jgi:hypothetical protein
MPEWLLNLLIMLGLLPSLLGLQLACFVLLRNPKE